MLALALLLATTTPDAALLVGTEVGASFFFPLGPRIAVYGAYDVTPSLRAQLMLDGAIDAVILEPVVGSSATLSWVTPLFDLRAPLSTELELGGGVVVDMVRVRNTDAPPSGNYAPLGGGVAIAAVGVRLPPFAIHVGARVAGVVELERFDGFVVQPTLNMGGSFRF